MLKPGPKGQMGKCKRCGQWADIRVIRPFCTQCYSIHYEKRVAHVIKSNKLIKRDDRVLMAVSGGKSSKLRAFIKTANCLIFTWALSIWMSILECANERSERVSEFARNVISHFILSGLRLLACDQQIKEKAAAMSVRSARRSSAT